MSWIVYILKCADETLYTGITNDLAARLEKHAAGSGAKYTRGRGPYEIVFEERFETRGEATRRELEIKKMTRTGKLGLISR